MNCRVIGSAEDGRSRGVGEGVSDVQSRRRNGRCSEYAMRRPRCGMQPDRLRAQCNRSAYLARPETGTDRAGGGGGRAGRIVLMGEVGIRFARGGGMMLAMRRTRVCANRLVALSDQKRRRHQ